ACTEAWSARISSSAIVAGASGSVVVVMSVAHLDQDVVALDLHRIRPDRHGGRQRPGPPRVQVEGGSVLGALDRLEVRVDLALVQVRVRVRADRLDGPEL